MPDARAKAWRRALAACVFTAFASLAGAAEPPTLRIPGIADRPVPPASLLGRGRMDIPVEGAVGDALVYHGLPLLEVLEKAGLDVRTMAGQRKSAPAIVVVTARDGYTAVFSVGELLMHRADPRVFLVAETAGGPLPENEGPVRMFVQGDRVRSPYGLKTLEVRYIAKNSSAEPKR
jgi:Oxidoreductase molybdopterin binding domain